MGRIFLIGILFCLAGSAGRGQEPSMLDYVQQGEQLANAGRIDEAIAVYQKAQAAGAGSAQFLNRLGELYLRGGQFDRGIETFKRSLGEDPEQVLVYASLGEAFLAASQLDSSVAYLEEARRRTPQSSRVHSSLGFVHLQNNDLEEARTFLARALALDGKNADAHRFLGLYFAQKDSLDKALEAYHEVIELVPEDIEAHNNVSFILTTQSKYQEALAFYTKTKELVRDPRLLLAIENNIDAVRALMAGKMRARLILVETVQQAEEVLMRLENGDDFAQLAAQYSQINRESGGDVGFFGPGDLQPEFEQEVLRLEVGQTSGVVQIPTGVMIIQRLN